MVKGAVVERVAADVFRVATSRRSANNVFLVRGDDGLTLVDTGWSRSPRAIASAIEALNRSLRDVRRIVIAHAHPDHVRGLAPLRKMTRASVLIHPGDRVVGCRWGSPARTQLQGRRAGGRLPMTRWTPVVAEALLSDQELISGSGGLRVLHTPGHTAGHVALLHEPTRPVLTGYAVFGRRFPSPGPRAVALDPRRVQASLALLSTDVTAVGFAHGAPLLGRAAAAYQRMHSIGGST